MPSIDITILNGLPVRVAFSIEAADPEAGYPHPHIAEWEITTSADSTHSCGTVVISPSFNPGRYDIFPSWPKSTNSASIPTDLSANIKSLTE